MVNKFLKKIMDRKKKFEEQLFFKRYNVNSWEEYYRKYDSDFDENSKTIEGLFHGYHSFHSVETHYVGDLFVPMPSQAKIKKWCEENCVGKYRIQELESWHFDDGLKYAKMESDIILVVAFKEKDDGVNYVLSYNPLYKQDEPLKSYYSKHKYTFYDHLPKNVTGIGKGYVNVVKTN